jgi:uncharacterized membrane protein YdbT with pleckstrin-like domain
MGVAAFLWLSEDLGEYAGMIALVCVIVAFGIFFEKYYNYAQGMLIITSQRVLNVEQKGFFKRRIIETDVNKIQDVSSNVSGVMRIFLKFGDLVIRTAGGSQGSEIIIKNIPHPYDVQQIIANIKK